MNEAMNDYIALLRADALKMFPGQPRSVFLSVRTRRLLRLIIVDSWVSLRACKRLMGHGALSRRDDDL